jgi:hypothetical protein
MCPPETACIPCAWPCAGRKNADPLRSLVSTDKLEALRGDGGSRDGGATQQRVLVSMQPLLQPPLTLQHGHPHSCQHHKESYHTLTVEQ